MASSTNSDQNLPEQTTQRTFIKPTFITPTCIDKTVSIDTSIDSDSEDDQINPQPNPDQPSSSNLPENLTTSEATDMEIDHSFSIVVTKTVSDQPLTSSTQTPTLQKANHQLLILN
jgi:hypothetical protein